MVLVGAYRFDWPRTNFLTFFLLEPRGVVRLALGAAFLRAARFTFLRSILSSIFFVSATQKTSFNRMFQSVPKIGDAKTMVTGI
jgi:hypothetical protein